MLLAQDPKLLLVDEPAAGMTDAETAETAELLKDIANDHSVVVVEHDMVFVRSWASRSRSCTKARSWQKGRLITSPPTNVSSKSISDGEEQCCK